MDVRAGSVGIPLRVGLQKEEGHPVVSAAIIGA